VTLTHTHRYIDTDRQTDTQTDRHRQRYTKRNTMSTFYNDTSKTLTQTDTDMH